MVNKDRKVKRIVEAAGSEYIWFAVLHDKVSFIFQPNKFLERRTNCLWEFRRKFPYEINYLKCSPVSEQISKQANLWDYSKALSLSNRPNKYIQGRNLMLDTCVSIYHEDIWIDISCWTRETLDLLIKSNIDTFQIPQKLNFKNSWNLIQNI